MFDSGSFFNKLGDTALSLGGRLGTNAIAGKEQANKEAYLREVADIAAINGSGPADIKEFLNFGKRDLTDTQTGARFNMTNPIVMIVAGLAAVLVIVLLIKK